MRSQILEIQLADADIAHGHLLRPSLQVSAPAIILINVSKLRCLSVLGTRNQRQYLNIVYRGCTDFQPIVIVIFAKNVSNVKTMSEKIIVPMFQN